MFRVCSPARVILAMWVLLTASLSGQDSGPADVRQAVQAYRQKSEADIIQEFVGLLALPNQASDKESIERNAQHIENMLEKRGVKTRLLRGGGPPVVYGELMTKGVHHMVAIYAHYDGQPVDRTRWHSDPFQPVLRNAPLEAGGQAIGLEELPSQDSGEWRLYARSAGDDKVSVMALLAALDALQATHIPMTVNLKIFLDGEEEAGSPHLREVLSRYRSLLDAELWLFGDGPTHQSRHPQLFFGVRGVTGVNLTVYGPSRQLHSGHYGNWAPNPAVMLVDLIGSMRDTEGRILIEGFYDAVRPISPLEQAALAQVPVVEQDLMMELHLGRTEGQGAPLNELIMLPALNVRGLQAGNVGSAARNAIPSEARATIGFRLVPDQQVADVRHLMETHIRGQGYHVVREEPDSKILRKYPKVVRMRWGGGYRAVRLPLSSPIAQAVIKVVEATIGEPVVKLPTLGGSLPLYVFEEELGAPIVGLPIANHDNKQHGPDENLRLQNLWDGIEIYAGLLATLGEALPPIGQ